MWNDRHALGVGLGAWQNASNIVLEKLCQSYGMCCCHVWVLISILSLIAFASNLIPQGCLASTLLSIINFSLLALINSLYFPYMDSSHASQVLNISLSINDPLLYLIWLKIIFATCIFFSPLNLKVVIYSLLSGSLLIKVGDNRYFQ